MTTLAGGIPPAVMPAGAVFALSQLIYDVRTHPALSLRGQKTLLRRALHTILHHQRVLPNPAWVAAAAGPGGIPDMTTPIEVVHLLSDSRADGATRRADIANDR